MVMPLTSRVGRAGITTAALLFMACASGKTLPDPTNINPSQPHPIGDQSYVNPGSGALNAGLGTAAAAAAGVAQRIAGGCYSNCVPGTVCNSKTGLCDVLPCRNDCTSSQYCDTSGPFPRCIDSKVNLKIDPAPKQK